MSFLVSPPNHTRPASLKLGLRSPRRTRDEFADLDRLDRPELDDEDDAGTAPESVPPSTERKVA
jgi:hypothetical protein